MEKTEDRGITRALLRSIGMGEEKVVEGVSYRAYLSSRTTASATGLLDGCRFCCNYNRKDGTLTIRRLERTDDTQT